MKLKTKIISAICAGALALSMPAMAFAVTYSPDMDKAEVEEFVDPTAVFTKNVTAANWSSLGYRQVIFDTGDQARSILNQQFGSASAYTENNVILDYQASVTKPGIENPDAYVEVTVKLSDTGKAMVKDSNLAGKNLIVVAKHTDSGLTDTTSATATVNADGTQITVKMTKFSEFVVTNLVAGDNGTPVDPDADVPADGENDGEGMPATGIAA